MAKLKGYFAMFAQFLKPMRAFMLCKPWITGKFHFIKGRGSHHALVPNPTVLFRCRKSSQCGSQSCSTCPLGRTKESELGSTSMALYIQGRHLRSALHRCLCTLHPGTGWKWYGLRFLVGPRHQSNHTSTGQILQRAPHFSSRMDLKLHSASTMPLETGSHCLSFRLTQCETCLWHCCSMHRSTLFSRHPLQQVTTQCSSAWRGPLTSWSSNSCCHKDGRKSNQNLGWTLCCWGSWLTNGHPKWLWFFPRTRTSSNLGRWVSQSVAWFLSRQSSFHAAPCEGSCAIMPPQ